LVCNLIEIRFFSAVRTLGKLVGYLLLFAAAFPLAAPLSLVCNLIEIRSDAFKLTFNARRPPAVRARNIGPWAAIVTAIVWLSALTNVLVAGLTSEQLAHMVPTILSPASPKATDGSHVPPPSQNMIMSRALDCLRFTVNLSTVNLSTVNLSTVNLSTVNLSTVNLRRRKSPMFCDADTDTYLTEQVWLARLVGTAAATRRGIGLMVALEHALLLCGVALTLGVRARPGWVVQDVRRREHEKKQALLQRLRHRHRRQQRQALRQEPQRPSQ
jgi:hypothetical protein